MTKSAPAENGDESTDLRIASEVVVMENTAPVAGQVEPTRHDLDPITGGRPAALVSRDSHSLWLN